MIASATADAANKVWFAAPRPISFATSTVGVLAIGGGSEEIMKDLASRQTGCEYKQGRNVE